MSDIALVSGQSLASHQEATAPRHRVHAGRVVGADPVTLDPPSAADFARWRRGLEEADDVRWSLVKAVRERIFSGDYLTDDRIKHASRQLARELEC